MSITPDLLLVFYSNRESVYPKTQQEGLDEPEDTNSIKSFIIFIFNKPKSV